MLVAFSGFLIVIGVWYIKTDIKVKREYVVFGCQFFFCPIYGRKKTPGCYKKNRKFFNLQKIPMPHKQHYFVKLNAMESSTLFG